MFNRFETVFRVSAITSVFSGSVDNREREKQQRGLDGGCGWTSWFGSLVSGGLNSPEARDSNSRWTEAVASALGPSRNFVIEELISTWAVGYGSGQHLSNFAKIRYETVTKRYYIYDYVWYMYYIYKRARLTDRLYICIYSRAFCCHAVAVLWHGQIAESNISARNDKLVNRKSVCPCPRFATFASAN